ncbi:MAG: transcription antitermination factor NusB [Candidatus Kapabacteria bacterium]|nr:transcription antitermination factor NusB [Candidatus Kapabacteria bacterium]
MPFENPDSFPLSRVTTLRGNRRLAREKVLQLLMVKIVSDTPIDKIYSHIFYRRFNFGDNEEHLVENKILKPDEVYELEADIPIIWTESDEEFAKKLLLHCVENMERFNKTIKDNSSNWNFDRITLTDKILIHMATNEFIYFDDVPPFVTLNEALSIAKRYSTDKSYVFINGILDKILKELNESGDIHKTGRGLIGWDK